MKRLFIIITMLVTAQISQAGHHEDGKILAKRQPDASMTVTSVDLGQEKTTITATGAMSEYGKVYVTYNLAYNSGRSGGLVTGQGRGQLLMILPLQYLRVTGIEMAPKSS